jgi:hypothetical protein
MALNFGKKIEVIKQAVATVEVSDESLMESIEQVAAASEALYEAQADGAVICQVLDNLGLAAQAIAKGGLSKQVIGAFNSEGELSAVCGMENLTVEGLEKLAEADVKALEAKYTAGVEGQMAEYWNKLVAWLKNLWTKLVNWFKNILTNQARYVQQLDAVTKSLDASKFNGDASVSLHTATQINDALTSAGRLIVNLEKESTSAGKSIIDLSGRDALTSAGRLIVNLEKAANEFKNSGKLADAKAVEASKKWYSLFGLFENDTKGLETYQNAEVKEQTIKAAGFSDVGKIKTLADAYKKVAASKSFATATKAFTDGLSQLVKEAGSAGALEGEAAANAKAAVNERRQGVTKMLDAIRKVAGVVQKCGGEILKAAKASQTKAAAAK